ncbi:MAG: ABC transporter ATP-binding protein, partial [Anaerolineae bacterium]|nr:ABC transporter ATP-binding protein [Anaerolineae bacterium]
IDTAGLSFTYPNGVQALNDITLRIRTGEYVALIGPNGAGKSTLARVIMGLLQPTAGKVMVNGQDTRATPVPALARTVGYAFQNPDHQIFAPTVREEIAFGPRNIGWQEREVNAAVDEMLSRFHLEELAEAPPAVLGYGLRRKIAVAAIAASRPAVLILDEPTGGLDRTTANELLDFLDELNRSGTTIILITHDMTIVAERARRSIVLIDGRIAFDGSPRELFLQKDVLARASLIPPPITRLAEMLGAPPEITPILSVEEFVQAWAEVPDHG